MKIELIPYKKDADRTCYYERYETTMAVSDFEYGEEFKDYCRECSNYRKNLSCPPYSPYFPDYVDKSTKARVICLRTPLAYYSNPSIEERCDTCFIEMKGVLESELLHYRKKGLIIAGSGACLYISTSADKRLRAKGDTPNDSRETDRKCHSSTAEEHRAAGSEQQHAISSG